MRRKKHQKNLTRKLEWHWTVQGLVGHSIYTARMSTNNVPSQPRMKTMREKRKYAQFTQTKISILLLQVKLSVGSHNSRGLAQTGVKGWFTWSYRESSNKLPNPQDSNTTIWGSSSSMGQWLLIKPIPPSAEARHPRCPTHPSCTDAGGHKAVWFVHCQRSVWNKSLTNSSRLTNKDHSTSWRVPGTHLRPHTVMGKPREGKTHHFPNIDWDTGHLGHFERRSGWVSDSKGGLGNPPPRPWHPTGTCNSYIKCH